MKTQRFVIILLAWMFAFAPQLFRTSTAEPLKYSAKVISPSAGQVLVAGQHVKITWESTLPHLDLNWCEAEIWLSLDGGTTFTPITGERDPRAKYLDWIVPNTPTRAAVLDIRFGCVGYYPESRSVQAQSAFVIR